MVDAVWSAAQGRSLASRSSSWLRASSTKPRVGTPCGQLHVVVERSGVVLVAARTVGFSGGVAPLLVQRVGVPCLTVLVRVVL